MSSNARFYTSLGLLVLLNGIIKPAWIFGIDRQVQNVVGAAEYGTYFSFLNLSIVFTFFLDWGMTGYFNRQLAADRQSFIAQTGNFLLLKLLFSGIYTLAVVICAKLSGITRWDIIWGVISIQVLTYIFVFLRAIITAEQWFKTDAWLSVLDKTLMILLCGYVLIFPAMLGSIDIKKFILFQIISTFIAISVTALILTRKGTSFKPFRFATFFNAKLFRNAFPYALLLLLMSAHFRIDAFLLERLHPNGAEEAGIYAASYRLLDAANMVGFLFASFVLPFIAKRWNAGENINNVVLNTRHFLLLFSLGLSSFVVFFAPWIHDLLYDLPAERITLVMQYCLPALIGYSIVSIYGTVMTATGHILPFCLLTFGALALNVTMNLLLIPTKGALACSYAAIVSQTSCGLATLLYCKFRLGVPVNIRSLIIYTFITVLLCVLFYFGRGIVSPWLLAIAAILITTIAGLLLRIINPEKLKQLVNT